MDKIGEILAFIFTFLIRAAVKIAAVFFIASGLYVMYTQKTVTLQQSAIIGIGLALFEVNGNVNYTPEKKI